MKTRKILVTAICLLIAAMLVRAAVLDYFGKVETTMETQQAIVISDDGETWNVHGEDVERNLGDIYPGVCYAYKLWIKNQGAIPAEASFSDSWISAPNGDSSGIDIHHYIFGDTQTINLRHKDPITWEVLEGAGADITFDTCGPTFDYAMDYWDIPEGEYSLVYYTDQDPRFEVWGQVSVIDTLVIEAGQGTGTQSGSIDMPTMPYIDDWNAGEEADYSVAPDNYEHAKGAKIWLVPSEDINDGQLTVWNPENYLFETDLALYINCDSEPICLEYVYPLFNTNVLLPGETYCWISSYHAAFDIMQGQYIVNTLLDAEELEP